MVVQLEAKGLPRPLNLLERENLLASVRARDLGLVRGPGHEGSFKRAEAVLITDCGMTSELEEILDYVVTRSMPRQKQNAENVRRLGARTSLPRHEITKKYPHLSYGHALLPRGGTWTGGQAGSTS